MATRRVSVEYIPRRVPQEGLEGERTYQDQTILSSSLSTMMTKALCIYA